MLSTGIPVGRLLGQNRVEAFRELLRYGEEKAEAVSCHFGVEATHTLFFRTYRVVRHRLTVAHRAATTSDALRVAVHEWPGRRPVVLAHAAGLHGMVWAPLATRLQPAFMAISFDLRGHGDSDVPPHLDFDWHGFACDVVAVVEEMPSAPYGFGHSSGGAALLLAEQARPGTFAALYCYEPTIVAADPPLGRDTDSWLAQAARRRREVFASRDEAYHHYAAKRAFSRLHPEALRAYVDHGFTDLDDGSVRLKCRRAHEALVYEMASAHDCFPRLPEVACPVRLACGGSTDGFGPEAIAALAARLPQASTEVLPGLGHLGPLEDPDAVAAAFARFVAATSPLAN